MNTMNGAGESQTLFYAISLDFSKPPGMIPLVGVNNLMVFNDYQFSDGEIIVDWPDGIVFHFEGDRVDDYWKPRLLWNLVSGRVKRILEQFQVEGIQLLPVTVIDNKTGKTHPYWELNVYQKVADLRWKYVQGLDIFRITSRDRGVEALPEIYISRRLKQALEEAGAVNGFGFRPISAWRLNRE
jgi:hypothetical protein